MKIIFSQKKKELSKHFENVWIERSICSNPPLNSTFPREAWAVANRGTGGTGNTSRNRRVKSGFRRRWVLRNARYANADSNIVQTFVVERNTVRISLICHACTLRCAPVERRSVPNARPTFFRLRTLVTAIWNHWPFMLYKRILLTKESSNLIPLVQ